MTLALQVYNVENVEEISSELNVLVYNIKTWRKEAQDTASWRVHQEGKREARELRRMRPTAKAAELETPRMVLMETQGRQPSLVLWSTSSMVRAKARLNRPC